MINNKSFFVICIFIGIISLITPKLHSFEISLPKTGTSLACSIGASSAFIAASYILTQHYKSVINNSQTQPPSWHRVPPAEFWWSILTASSCIAALFVFADDSNDTILERVTQKI